MTTTQQIAEIAASQTELQTGSTVVKVIAFDLPADVRREVAEILEGRR